MLHTNLEHAVKDVTAFMLDLILLVRGGVRCYERNLDKRVHL